MLQCLFSYCLPYILPYFQWSFYHFIDYVIQEVRTELSLEKMMASICGVVAPKPARSIEYPENEAIPPLTSDRKRLQNRLAARKYRNKRADALNKRKSELAELRKKQDRLKAEETSLAAEILECKLLLKEKVNIDLAEDVRI
uniref:BZIP domain-containing protein n=1 Tax=Panagrellus redivivus TaxID=6233 RepID=A0A7E4ZX07_PANRE